MMMDVSFLLLKDKKLCGAAHTGRTFRNVLRYFIVVQ